MAQPPLPDPNTNIMLDLETTSTAANPCIIELSATHFNLSTGQEYSFFNTIISLDSCREARLHVSGDTLAWLQENIPGTLHRAERSQVTLRSALLDFAAWVRGCCVRNLESESGGGGGKGEGQGTEGEAKGKGGSERKGELLIWGNGAFSDNRWIDSAYAAVGLSHVMPWKYWGHMCVRTFVKQVKDLTGRDFARGVRMRGVKHVALDDCRHQVRYLVLARRAVRGVEGVGLGFGGVDEEGVLPCEIEEGVIRRDEVGEEEELHIEDNKKEPSKEEEEVVEEDKQEENPEIDGENESENEKEKEEGEEPTIEEQITLTEKKLDELKSILTARNKASALHMQNEAAKAQNTTVHVNPSRTRTQGAAIRMPSGLGLMTPETSFSGAIPEGVGYEDLTLTHETETDVETDDDGRELPNKKRRVGVDVDVGIDIER